MTANTQDWNDVVNKLSQPFEAHEIGVKVGATNGDKSSGMVLTYIDARALMNRLDAVVGPNPGASGSITAWCVQAGSSNVFKQQLQIFISALPSPQ